MPELWGEATQRAMDAGLEPTRVRRIPWMLLAATLLLAAALGGAVLVGSGLIKLPALPIMPDLPDASAAPNEATPAPTAHAAAWTAAGNMIEARGFGYTTTATLLSDGKVLVAGFLTESTAGELASPELFDPITGTWTATGAMIEVRYEGYTGTLLPDGKVLVAGGWAGTGHALASAELYDPSSGTWSATGSMKAGRFHHTATLLADGRVLVAGGMGTGGYLSSAELYDPRTGSWTVTGSMSEAREYHTATLLLDGTVLVAGGDGNEALVSAELFDPRTGTWTVTGSMTQARGNSPATLLPDGTVLVAGGDSATAVVQPDGGGPAPDALTLASAELYDPRTGSWTPTGSMTEARRGHAATLLPNGTVLVAGGYRSDTSGNRLLASAELYDPRTGSWTATGSMLEARSGHTATLLAGGAVLVVGGIDSDAPASAELYDPGSGS